MRVLFQGYADILRPGLQYGPHNSAPNENPHGYEVDAPAIGLGSKRATAQMELHKPIVVPPERGAQALARFRKRMTADRIPQLLAEGRGNTARGSEYIPWIKVQDIPSNGIRYRIPWWVTHRAHHLLSTHEANAFRNVALDPTVSDIREQFPLLPIEETLEIAGDIGVTHPRERGTRTPYVMTTDILLTRDGIDIPWTVKPASELEKTGVLDLLEVERRYWARRQKQLVVFTNEDMTSALAHNLEYLYPYGEIDYVVRCLEGRPARALIAAMRGAMLTATGVLREETVGLQEAFGLDDRDVLLLVLHVLASMMPTFQRGLEAIDFRGRKPMDVALEELRHGC